jgi:hypothetical protein
LCAHHAMHPIFSERCRCIVFLLFELQKVFVSFLKAAFF